MAAYRRLSFIVSVLSDIVHLHFIPFMSRFTSIMSSDAPTSGAMSDALTSNALLAVGSAGLAGVGVMSVAVTATVLPAQTIVLAGASTLALIAGKRQAEGKSLVPDIAGMVQRKSADTPTSDIAADATPVAAAV